MKFKVGDKVKVTSRYEIDKISIGKKFLKNNKIIRIEGTEYIVKARLGWKNKQYGNGRYWALNENELQLIKPKSSHITLAQASKSAEREKAEQERVIEITEKFIRVLGR